MRVDVENYRRLWRESLNQPKVAGPQEDFWYQRVGRYVRAIACEVTRPFVVPVGNTAEVSGLNPRFIGAYLGQLVRSGVVRVVQSGAPGRSTRYEFCPQRYVCLAC